MKIIVGLGNPGDKYAGTRHNTGFSVLTAIADKYNIDMNKKECKSITGRGIIGGEKVLLAMPQTYMNLSGEAVVELLNFYKCDVEDLIIIYDDIDLDVGGLRIRATGSGGGHNGMKNIIQLTGKSNIIRVRVGVGAKPQGWDLADHVLGRFSSEDLPKFREAVGKAVEAVEIIVEKDVNAAMNALNKK